jgi:hypothetical protein
MSHAFLFFSTLAVSATALLFSWWRPEPTRPLTRVFLLHRVGAWVRTAARWHVSALVWLGTCLAWFHILYDDAPNFDVLPAAGLAALAALLVTTGTSDVLRYVSARLAPAFRNRRLPPRMVASGYRLPAVPTDPTGPLLIAGETHPDRVYYANGEFRIIPVRGARYSPAPDWLVLNQIALATGTLIYGSTGSGKTAFLILSAVLDLFNHPTRPGGLVMDSKATLAKPLKDAMDAFGRGADVFSVGPHSSVRWNPIHMPAASAARIAELLMAAKENMNGAKFKAEQRWIPDGAAAIAEGAIGILRLTMPGSYVTPAHLRLFLTKLTVACQGQDMPAEVVSNVVLSLFGGKRPTGADSAWYEHFLDLLVKRFAEDEKFRAIYVNELSGLLVRLTDPAVSDKFNAPLADLDMPSWEEATERGLVCVLDCNAKDQPGLAVLLGTLLKLGYEDCMIARPVLTDRGVITSERAMVLCIDEYQQFASLSDCEYVAVCRQSKSLTVFATQGPASIEERLGKDDARVLTQSLRNKFIFNCEEADTIAELIGQEEVRDINRTVNESQQDAAMTLSGRMAGHSSVSETLSEQRRREFIVKPEDIRALALGECLFRGHDGERAIPVQRIFPRPFFGAHVRHADGRFALQIMGGDYVHG